MERYELFKQLSAKYPPDFWHIILSRFFDKQENKVLKVMLDVIENPKIK